MTKTAMNLLRLSAIKAEKAALNAEEEAIKKELLAYFHRYGLTSLVKDGITYAMTYKKAFERKGGIDEKRLTAEHPEINLDAYRKKATLVSETVGVTTK